MEVKEDKFYVSIANNDPDKIMNIELTTDQNRIWIKTNAGTLYSTTLRDIICYLESYWIEAEKKGITKSISLL